MPRNVSTDQLGSTFAVVRPSEPCGQNYGTNPISRNPNKLKPLTHFAERTQFPGPSAVPPPRLHVPKPDTLSTLAPAFSATCLWPLSCTSLSLAAAYALARLMASLVWGVTATDPATFLGISVTLVAAATLALYIPARRAMHIDPIVALRYE